jgi:hypothetical protein
MVCRVEVLITADFPTRVASKSMLAPSSCDSAVGSRSRSSTTFPTRYGNCLAKGKTSEYHPSTTLASGYVPVVFYLV